MSTVLYDIGVNLIGGVVSAVLVLWVTARWQNTSDLRWQLVRLRNVLFDVERAISPQIGKTTFSSTGTFIWTPVVEEAEWFGWENQCREIRYALFEISQRWTLSAELLRSRFKVERESALAHFQAIGSVFVNRAPVNYLGVIECTTETVNLLREARRETGELVRHAADYRDFLDQPEPKGAMVDMKPFEEELEEVRTKIKRHREYVEKLVPNPAFQKID